MMTIFGSWYFQPQLGWAKIRYIEFAGVRATGSPYGHGVYFLMGELDQADKAALEVLSSEALPAEELRTLSRLRQMIRARKQSQ